MEIDPALEEVAAEASTARFGLLFNPDPQGLRRYAFRQASENAAVDRPQQALAWMRLVQLAERCGTRLAMDSSAFSDIDRVRASYLHRLAEEFAAGREDALAEKASDIQPPPPP